MPPVPCLPPFIHRTTHFPAQVCTHLQHRPAACSDSRRQQCHWNSWGEGARNARASSSTGNAGGCTKAMQAEARALLPPELPPLHAVGRCTSCCTYWAHQTPHVECSTNAIRRSSGTSAEHPWRSRFGGRKCGSPASTQASTQCAQPLQAPVRTSGHSVMPCSLLSSARSGPAARGTQKTPPCLLPPGEDTAPLSTLAAARRR